ncbi:hypothetical protein [Nonomuraea gerenzanensis]|uniref:Phage protein n=1 Tax=Nonomuraea gerenzanensis TaxID=93944 RepID=A0A1M4BKU4_9ACTN|nr:hypothetical protein [Nonomuraea gerenzanensis]UBU10036.1 hypothetical protein LCN96_37545 [Nonomuraea gerenzanensis]SAP16255.1 hypothetical protein BN4615_P10918 [Nonomuraea gerenzanensis]
MVEVRITGADQLAKLAKRLKAAGDDGKKLRKELLKAIRAGAKPALADTRRAVRTIPVTGSRGGGRKAREEHQFERSRGDEDRRRARARKGAGLRDSVARSLRLVVKTGSKTPLVRIEVDASKMPPDQRTLPKHLDAVKGWRHPTFGRDPWVHQQGRPWFRVTIKRHAPAVRARILKAMDDIADKIEG